MALQGQKGVPFVHAVAVVRDCDRLATTILDLDLNTSSASIQSIFNEFLDDAGRPFDHFAGGDLVDHVIR